MPNPTWFYARSGQQIGPVEFEELRRLSQSGQLAPADLVIHENPAPVASRLFFVRDALSVPDMTAASSALFPNKRGNPGGYRPQERSYVEGLPADRVFPVAGSASAEFQNSRVTVTVTPAAEERFLVLNERYEPNWTARDDAGNELRILPTNVMMRGVVVPPAARRIVFEYRPFLVRPAAFFFYAAGLALAAAIAAIARARRQKR